MLEGLNAAENGMLTCLSHSMVNLPYQAAHAAHACRMHAACMSSPHQLLNKGLGLINVPHK